MTGKQVCIDEDEDFDGTPDIESDSDDEGSDSDLDNDAHGYGSDDSMESIGSMAEFYGLLRHQRSSAQDDLEPGSSADEQDLVPDEDSDAEDREIAVDMDVELDAEVGEDPEGVEVAGNVENDEDYYMDDMYEQEGYARL